MNTHGNISFLWEDDLFVASVEGAFNEEAIAYYTPLLQEAILTRKHAQWRRLEIWNSEDEQKENTVAGLRRTIPRFIGTVCVALSLEGLIMVIKYSQLDLAGNLYYPVAIISSTALLLTALALFIHLTKDNAK